MTASARTVVSDEVGALRALAGPGASEHEHGARQTLGELLVHVAHDLLVHFLPGYIRVDFATFA